MIGTSQRFQNGSLTLMKNKKADDSWFFRYYDYAAGKRIYRNVRIGSARDYPRRRDAEKAVLSLRSNINTGVRVPETLGDLITHYRERELTLQRKAYATVEAHRSYLMLHILPKLKAYRLTEVKTTDVEGWLEKMKLAPATRTKIRNIMSAVFSHGIRHDFVRHNPITEVRTSAKRLREPDVLKPSEFNSLLKNSLCGIASPSCLPVRLVFVALSCSLCGGVISTSSRWKSPSPVVW
jgi:hypothetical protein